MAVGHDEAGAAGFRVDASSSATDNSSYSAIRTTSDTLGIFANTTAKGGDGNYGLSVVLPAVLASVLGAAALAAIIAALLIRRRRKSAAAGGKGSKHSTGTQPGTWLPGLVGGTAAASSAGRSSDPARQLLGIHSTPGTGTSGDTARSPRDAAISLPAHVAPDGIVLNMLLGVGSFGRVYSATWNGAPVAVKIITHSSAYNDKIGRELALSLSFDHPNLVRALHFAKLRVSPGSGAASLGTPAHDSLFLPDGAVGVFTLPKDWAVARTAQQGQEMTSDVDSETWIVMDLMDRGNLAAAVRHSRLFMDDAGGDLDAVGLLRRAADVAAGVSYLHSRNVCHGDLKCENVLLRSEGQDPYGCLAKVADFGLSWPSGRWGVWDAVTRVMSCYHNIGACLAKVADFGLSRALAFGQSHLSTRRYGTVTHMPPEHT
ncbi:hypothetical protein OEZ86_013381 [Tetradesmus obliquus]|nr:hypothetical protein OEZ86_013381 [Tetradesmus obliquus]